MNLLDSALIDSVREAATGRHEDLVALCSALVAAPSANPPGDTRQVADVVLRALRDRGIAGALDREEPTMPSVVATLDSGRPGPHLVLNVHLDTMPPGDESTWSVPVLSLTRRDGRLYGLGMGNMKGAVAAMTLAAELLTMIGGWTGRVTYAAVSDEVVFGEHGAAYLLRRHPELLGDGLLCGEGPGFDRTAVGEKGVLWLELATTGAAGHSSSVVRGESAAARLAEAVLAVDALTGTRGELPPELAGLSSPEGDPGLSLTANVGVVASGTFVGQRATTGRAEVDLRLPPGVTADDAQAAVRAALSPEVSIRRIKGWDANWTSPASPLLHAWELAHRAVTGGGAVHAVRLPASDASRWRRAGVPALCYGPQPTFSAGVDDYAQEDAVQRCAQLYCLAAMAFLAPQKSG